MWRIALCLLAVLAADAQNYIISSVAGGGAAVGQSTSFGLYQPSVVAADAAGNFYGATDCQVWAANPAGIVTQLIGSGTCGYSGDNGPAASAQLNGVAGIAVDLSGNIYIADVVNSHIRKVADGVITNVAGTVTPGYNGDNIAASSAELSGPAGIAVDSAGNLYIADQGNSRIRKVSGGIITTVAGNGKQGYNGDSIDAVNAELAGPNSVAVDSAGNLYISDESNQRIRKVSGGIITTVAGNGTPGYNSDSIFAVNASILDPAGVAVDSAGNLYIADYGNNRIRKVSKGIITTIAGTGAFGYNGDGINSAAAELANPSGVAVDSAGNLYIADTVNNRIRRVSGGIITTVAGGDGILATRALLAYPKALALDSSGNLFIADTGGEVVRKVAAGTGIITTIAGNGSDAPPDNSDNVSATSASIDGPDAVTVDSNGNVFVGNISPDEWTPSIRRITNGVLTIEVYNIGSGGVALDADGNLYFTDYAGCTAKILLNGGILAVIAGNGTCGNFGEGVNATLAQLNHPAGIAVDGSRNIYIADTGNNRIMKLSGGVITTVPVSGLNQPFGVAVDRSGQIYIADTGNHRVLKAFGGVVTTIAGTGTPGYNGDNIRANSAQLNYPAGVAVDSSGNVYIADAANGRVRKLTLAAPSVHIDTPGANTVISGTVTLTGWAIDSTSMVGTSIGGVQVQVDGVVVGNASYGISRTDVCLAYPGRPGCPNVGFTFQLNTASLTAGAHIITALATDTDSNPDMGSSSVTVTVLPSLPSVFIDTPSAAATVSGTVTVTGWAIDSAGAVGTPISSVQIKVDGAVAGNAVYGVSRIDVCNAFPGRAGCPNVGFSFTLNTALLTLGAHTITAVATDEDSTPDVGSYSTTVTVVAPPSVFIDSPPNGATVSGTIAVAGWAIDSTSVLGTAIANVQVKVDGVLVGTASYGSSRTDVCAAYPGRVGCPNVGFNFLLNTASLSPGTHTITAVATDKDANPDMGSYSVTVTVPAGVTSPSVLIDSPSTGATMSGTVTVWGWAIDNVARIGGAIGSVQVFLDNQVVGNATYGTPRTDVCAVYPGRVGCPNVGFTYQLDTSSLSAGNHTITVLASGQNASNGAGSSSVVVKK